MKNEMKIEFLSIPENESFARTVAAAFVLSLDPITEEMSEIKTAVSEAVTNSIIHGYSGNRGIITLTGRINENTVIFTVSDLGCGIENIDKAREPLYSGSKDGERSGMGFTIMEAFMDGVKIESTPNKGTTVIMTKIICQGRAVI